MSVKLQWLDVLRWILRRLKGAGEKSCLYSGDLTLPSQPKWRDKLENVLKAVFWTWYLARPWPRRQGSLFGGNGRVESAKNYSPALGKFLVLLFFGLMLEDTICVFEAYFTKMEEFREVVDVDLRIVQAALGGALVCCPRSLFTKRDALEDEIEVRGALERSRWMSGNAQ